MDRPEFRALIERLHEDSQQRPKRYVFRVTCMVLFGYLVMLVGLLYALLGMVTFALIGMVGFAVPILLFLFLPFWQKSIDGSVMAWRIVSTVWLGGGGGGEPGLPIRREQAPRLFALIDEVGEGLGGVRLHRAFIAGQTTAMVRQVGGLRGIGRSRNDLVLGLPLMLSLSEAQLRAVLAHELGHLRDEHGRIAAFAHRVGMRWSKLDATLSRRFFETHWLRRFAAWFIPRAFAHARAMERSHEFAADWASVQLAGGETSATALLTIAVAHEHLDKVFWAAVSQLANEQPEPPDDVYLQLIENLRQGVDPERAKDVVEQNLQAVTGLDTVHPCLAERLHVMGFEPPPREQMNPAGWLPTVERSSAAGLLGARLKPLAAELSADWRDGVAEAWRERHERAAELREYLKQQPGESDAHEAADADEARSPVSTTGGGAAVAEAAAWIAGEPDAPAESDKVEQLWGRATATLELHGEHEAVPLFERVLKADPEHAGANYLLAQILLTRHDERGVAHMRRAMAADVRIRPEGCGWLAEHYRRAGDPLASEQWADRADRAYEEQALAEKERQQVNPRSRFVPHDLPESLVKELQRTVASFAVVKWAFLAQHRAIHLPELPHYVLVIERRETFLWPFRQARKLANKIASAVPIPGLSVFVVYPSTEPEWRRRFKYLNKALIYRKPKRRLFGLLPPRKN